ncbi:ATP-binding cassette domain-containing protein [Spiroplasma diminutum]|uniref:ABC transporter ATP-binding protein n=1 Tax=Spiroplasma diminutum CUAS-1 TaxID=1276221 RepID=S5M2K9_9MOLU|nr:ATP-binding cassette domain-containing protein [Spiroplasma diminutum]AGR42327.1 ABC transporter ATP-binding protein [Spiroplasma diminutum CUAS-1]
MESKEISVSLENVSKIFNKSVWAIKKINLKIYKGEGIAIIGPNQSGKSVLGRLIASQIKQSGGVIEYNFNNDNIMSNIGFQFRQTTWPEGFTVKEVFNLYKHIHDVNDKKWIEDIVNVFGIDSRWDKTLTSCNTSWLQLFSIALAIINKPNLVVLDEVSSSIGLDFKIKILNFLKEYKEENNATFVVISPDDSTFEFLCERVIVLENGFIISDDYITDWKNNLTFEKYSLNIMDAIKQNEITVKPDPLFKPIIKKFETNSAIFRDKYNIFLEKNIGHEHEPNIVEIRNIDFHINELQNILENLLSTAINRKNIEQVILHTKMLIKIFKKTKKKINKIDPKIKYKKSALMFFNRTERFLEYLEQDLYKSFKSNKYIAYATELTAELSKKELEKLSALKKKYIQEEIKSMKLENRILKKQQKQEKNKKRRS